MDFRIVFMGTPDFSVPTLEALIAAGYDICAVYTQPPRPAGRRGLELTKSPVHQAAERHGIEVRTPVNFKNPADIADFSALDADAAVVVAYGLLLPPSILAAPRLGAYNGHASLLPRWRGAAPIQRAIMAGDEQTGMMIMKMDAGLDTGPVAMTDSVVIDPDMTAGALHDLLSQRGAGLMVQAIQKLQAGTLDLVAQRETGVVYAAKIGKNETRINFDQSARDVHNHIRGLSPFPGAWFEASLAGRRERVKVLKSQLANGNGPAGTLLDDHLTIACSRGAVKLMRLQKAGGKPLDADEFLRGNPLVPGTRFD